MNYLLDRKMKRKKFIYVAFFVVACFVIFYFRSPIFNSFSFLSHEIFSPVLSLGGKIGQKFRNAGAYFISKNFLYLENENLKSQLAEDRALMSNYNSIIAENTNLKEILGRKNEKTKTILSAILGKPNQSPYDTLIIDVGKKEGVEAGDTVFVLGNVPIGRVNAAYDSSSKVTLFSNSGEKTQVVVGGMNIFMEVVGRGGGNFEMILPRDFTLSRGDQVVLPGIVPLVLGIVETIISDPSDSFQKALLVSPVNIQELKFVQIELQR